MKKLSILALDLFLLCLCFSACTHTAGGSLFSDGDASKWRTSGDVTVNDQGLTLTGNEARAVLKNSQYRNFDLRLRLRTTPGGKGAIWFHTDPELKKGYRIALNNNVEDPVWWKMTGSLLSVRNLTKSRVKENEWFDMHIRVEGREIAVRVNGEPVVEYIEPTAPYRTDAHKYALLSEGTFALVSEGAGSLQFEKISVEEVDPDEIDLEAQLAEAGDEQNDEIIRLHQADFPVLDYHVHLKGGLTKEVAARQSRRLGINYAIAPNCGIGFPITNDQQITAYLDSMRTEPFILAMQAEGREWLTTFSPQARGEFDYVFTDALTFTDAKGRRTRLWIPEETWIENEQAYMDLIVDKICNVLKEPVDIYVNPCFLPAPMDQHFDEFWTEKRMNKFIEALAQSGKALEINELYQIPSKAILMKAKAAGVKFTFGSNNVTPDVSRLEYSIRMMKECGLTAKDMYKPRIKI